MSYILSALKKAEEERRRGSVPDALTVQQAVGGSSFPPPRRMAIKQYLIGGLAVLILSGAWLAKEFYSDDKIVVVRHGSSLSVEPAEAVRQSGAPPGAASATVQRGVPVVVKSGDATYSVRFGDQPTASVQNAPAVPAAHGFSGEQGISRNFSDTDLEAARGPSGVAYDDRIRDIDELPPSLRGELPRLVLSGHLYSLKHPQARKVILNGVVLKENQYLDDDLAVSEITSDGVILDFRGMLFSMNASRMFR